MWNDWASDCTMKLHLWNPGPLSLQGSCYDSLLISKLIVDGSLFSSEQAGCIFCFVYFIGSALSSSGMRLYARSLDSDEKFRGVNYVGIMKKLKIPDVNGLILYQPTLDEQVLKSMEFSDYLFLDQKEHCLVLHTKFLDIWFNGSWAFGCGIFAFSVVRSYLPQFNACM